VTTSRSLIAAATLSAIAGLLCAGVAAGQTRAVEALNFEAALSTWDIDTDDSVSSGTIGVSAGGTLPLGKYFGAALGLGYSETKVRNRDVLQTASSTPVTLPSCTFDNQDGNASLFARWPGVGKITGGYGVGKVSSDCGEGTFITTGNEKLDTDRYRVDAEFYLGDFTVAAGRTTTEPEDSPKLETTSWSLSWYALDSLKVSAFGNDLNERDTYGLGLEAQPEFMGDGLSVRIGYSRANDEPRTSTVTLGMTYYFRTRVPLKTRDRQYR
jgi:hypothetical protein